jgi:putative DNA primase/helicase
MSEYPDHGQSEQPFGRGNGYYAGSTEGSEGHEIPIALHDEIASWRRIIDRADSHNARGLLELAALDLFRILLIVTTEAPVCHSIAHNVVLDALQEFADFHGIGVDDAQHIIAEGSAAAGAESDGNTNGSAAAANDAPKASSLIACKASEVQPEKIEWIWPGRIARGKHTAIAGDPGAGKSQLMISIVAAVTTGGALPCGEGYAPIGNVIVLAAEDGVADTIVPRLHAAGAEVGRVHIVMGVRGDNGARMVNLQNDLGELSKKLTEIGDVRLICVDPVSSYLGKVDSHKNAELRAVLEPLSRMAEETGAAVLSITHFSKAGSISTKALYRFIGSLAFVAAPRMAFAVVADPDDAERRLFLHVKNNLAKPPQGLAFRLAQRIVSDDVIGSHVVWDSQPVSMTADQAVGADNGSEPTAKDDAISFLEQILADGPVDVPVLEQSAREAGMLGVGQSISQSKPFRSARRHLGIKPAQHKGKKSPGWFWALPAHQVPSDSSDAPDKERAPDVSEGI